MGTEFAVPEHAGTAVPGPGSGAGSLDPIAVGIREGIRRADEAELSVREINDQKLDDIARAVVENVLRRVDQKPLSDQQAVLLAEHVTLTLAAGVSVEELYSWITILCGHW